MLFLVTNFFYSWDQHLRAPQNAEALLLIILLAVPIYLVNALEVALLG